MAYRNKVRNVSGHCPVKGCDQRSNEYSVDKGYCNAHSFASTVLYTHKVTWPQRLGKLSESERARFNKVISPAIFGAVGKLDFMALADGPKSSGVNTPQGIDESIATLLARNPQRVGDIGKAIVAAVAKNKKKSK